MLKFLKGDLMASEAQALVNTVNTVGVMGKGIALQFKNAFPHNYELYRHACQSGQLQIGGLLIVQEQHLLMGERLIINLPTKKHWRNPSEYDYIQKGLIALQHAITMNDIKSLAMPALGCGNGGLDWQKVKSMIVRHLADRNCAIEVYEPDGLA